MKSLCRQLGDSTISVFIVKERFYMDCLMGGSDNLHMSDVSDGNVTVSDGGRMTLISRWYLLGMTTRGINYLLLTLWWLLMLLLWLLLLLLLSLFLYIKMNTFCLDDFI